MSDDLREELSAAFSSAKEEAAPVESAPVQSEVTPAEVAPVEAAPAPEKKAAEGRDDKGRFAPKARDAPTVAPTPGKVAPAALSAPASTEPISAPVPTEPIKPPQSWKADVREKFATLPPEVQREVLRREKETAVALQESVQARKTAEEFQRTVAPFEAMIRAEGSDPVKAVGNLLQTAAALRTAPGPHKAQLVAQLIKTYGVPIEDLDRALSGEAPQQGQAQQAGPMRDPRFDQFLQGLEQRKAAKQQAEVQKFISEAEAFAASPEGEFFEDVRADVTDIIEMAHRRGLNIGLQEAYNRAVKLNPDVSRVLEQRQAAKQAANAQASTLQARNAASSVKSQPAGPQTAGEPDDIRGALKAAMASSRT